MTSKVFFQLILMLLVMGSSNYNLPAQSLSYRQGELLVQLTSGVTLDHPGRSKLTSRSQSAFYKIQQFNKLATSFNIWKLTFDYSKWSTSDLIRELSTLPEVVNIQKNHLIQSRITPGDPLFTSQWYDLNPQNPNIDFDSDKAWDLTTGGITDSGDTIVICVIDDGLELTHEDIQPNLWINHAEIPSNGVDDDQNGYIDDYRGWNTYQSNDQFDNGKHGTPVSGLAAARGNNSHGIAGISWNVKLMIVEGGGDEANAIESYTYPFKLRKIYNESKGLKGAFVVATNSSWGSDYGKPEDAPLWCAIYDSLGSVGIVSVASTSNLNINVDVDGDLPTACESEFLIAVTSMNMQNLRDPYAAYGPKSIDLGAYGENVITSFINNTYRSFNGTSAASPQVTGAVALIYSLPCSNLSVLARVNPVLAALEVKKVLLQSVRPNSDLKDKTVSGGVLNLYQALISSTPLVSTVKINELLFEWPGSAILPVYFRYRKLNDLNWKDTTIYTGNKFLLTGLELCTEYELQYKNICIRNNDVYSPVRIYKTSGCCNAPSDFKLVNNLGSEVQLSYRSDGDKLITLIRLTGTTRWDTFIIPPILNPFVLNNLDPCSQYEMIAYSLCNKLPTALSRPFIFNTDGCATCGGLDYCKRFKPSSELEWLDAIKINNVEFKSGNNFGYGYYVGSNHQWIFEKGKDYTIEFKAGYLNDTSQLVLAAWIDYNENGDFENIENIAIPTTKFESSITYNLHIPANAISGLTRMRVCLKFAEISEATPIPCFQSLEFGEYEDYCVLITSATCNPVTSIDLSSIDPQTAKLSIVDPAAVAFRFSYRKLYDGPWISNISSAHQILLNGLDSCSRYELKLQSICNEFESKASFYEFNTGGTGCTVSAENAVRSQISVYPNPFTNELIILNKDEIYISAVHLFSVAGNNIYSSKVESNIKQLRMSFDIKPGYYILQVISKNGMIKNIPVICTAY